MSHNKICASLRGTQILFLGIKTVIHAPGFYEPVVGFNARCGAGVLVLLSVCRLYILAANGSGTNAFTLRGCGIRDTYIDYAN